jgi:CHRD domain
MRKALLTIALLTAAAIPALAVASAEVMSPVVSAKLTGRTEVPKGDPDGKGLAVLHLNATKATACWDFKGIAKIGRPTAAHIHKAPVGKAGPVVVPFGTTYKAKGCVKAAKKVIVAIETRPNSYYVNIHNAEYPSGAIRGQLVVGMTG